MYKVITRFMYNYSNQLQYPLLKKLQLFVFDCTSFMVYFENKKKNLTDYKNIIFKINILKWNLNI